MRKGTHKKNCILKEQERLYKNLYKSSTIGPDIALKIISSFPNNLNIPPLSEDQKTFCKGKISADECFCHLDSFGNNKTPGNDGIPIEFYKTFQSIISDSFIWIALVQVQKKSSFLKKQAIITLKEKLEIDLQSPSLMYM